jgi:LuxR family maltose regulon positive regulatory protein
MMEPAADDAVAHLRSALEAAGPARLLHVRLTSLAHLAAVHTHLGELGAAIAYGTEVVHYAGQRGQGEHQALATACLALGKAHYLRDDLEAARAYLDQAAGAVPRTDIPRRWGIARLRAWLHRAAGDVASARAMLTEAQRAMAEWAEPAPWVGPMAALEEAEQVAAEGDLEAALELLSGAAAGAPAGYRMIHVVLASIQLRAGSFADARRTLEPWLQRAPSQRVAGVASWALDAAASASLGDEPSAQASLKRAVVLAAPDSIRRPFVDEARHVRPVLRQFVESRTPFTAFALELLERTSGPRRHGRPWPAQLTEPLSGRELTVLRHLQSPLTLSEIAGQLYVSVNTIKSQARSIYRKLGVDDRHQAAQRARDLGLG